MKPSACHGHHDRPRAARGDFPGHDRLVDSKHHSLCAFTNRAKMWGREGQRKRLGREGGGGGEGGGTQGGGGEEHLEGLEESTTAQHPPENDALSLSHFRQLRHEVDMEPRRHDCVAHPFQERVLLLPPPPPLTDRVPPSESILGASKKSFQSTRQRALKFNPFSCRCVPLAAESPP